MIEGAGIQRWKDKDRKKEVSHNAIISGKPAWIREENKLYLKNEVCVLLQKILLTQVLSASAHYFK